MSSNHCGWPTVKPKFIYMGLNAYICIRCNYVQIDKKNIISHLNTQHDEDHIPITSIDSEYKEIVLIPPLKDVRAQANPNLNKRVQSISKFFHFLIRNSCSSPNVNEILCFFSAFVKPEPTMSSNSSLADTSSSQINVLENIVIHPAHSSSNDGIGDDVTIYDDEAKTAVIFTESSYLYECDDGKYNNMVHFI